MKALFTSRITKWAAAAAMAVVGWFVGHDVIATPDAAKATDELTLLLNGLFAAGFAVLAWVAGILIKKFTGRDSGGSDAGSSGGMSPCFLVTAAALLMAVGLPSCTAVSSAITGQPVAGTAVQRAGHDDATPVLIASGDLAQAEAAAEAAAKAKQPPAVHGLYDVGRAATAIREVFTESGK